MSCACVPLGGVAGKLCLNRIPQRLIDDQRMLTGASPVSGYTARKPFDGLRTARPTRCSAANLGQTARRRLAF